MRDTAGSRIPKRLIPLVTLILIVSLLASGFSCISLSSRGIGGGWNPDQLGSGTISRLPLSGGGSHYSESTIITSQSELDDFISAVQQQADRHCILEHLHHANCIHVEFLDDMRQWQIDFTAHNLVFYQRCEGSGGNVVTLGRPVVEGNEVTVDVHIEYGMTCDIGAHCYAYIVNKAVTSVTFVMEYEDDVSFDLSNGEVVVEDITQGGPGPSGSSPVEISRLPLSERSYRSSESLIITSQTEFDDFISAATWSWQINTPSTYPHDVLQWQIDFDTHNLILYWNTETSGGTVVTLGEPLVDGDAVTIDVHRGPLGDTADMAYYRYAYKVSKAITNVTFDVQGKGNVLFNMSNGQIVTMCYHPPLQDPQSEPVG